MRHWPVIIVLVGALVFASGAAAREKLSRDLPVLIVADELSYDEELGAAVARGNVEIVQGNRTLLADTVSYNQKTDTVSASGNVILHEPTGEVLFAEFVELTDKMKNGVVKQIRLLLNDDSRFAANNARRLDGNRTLMRKAIYSPCKSCEEDPERPLVWQLKANRVEHDQAAREIRYRDVFLEMWGVPVAYTPYLSHPDPSVKRRSGFLAPDFGTGGDVGAHLRLPYFIVIDDSKDVTVEPIYTREEGLVLSGEYRQRFNKGFLEITGSVTEAERREGDSDNPSIKSDRVRGHFTTKAEYHIDETWRAGIDLARSSDRSYLRKFYFFTLNKNTLRSNAYLEGFRRRNYMAANGYWFQDLRTDSNEDQPVVGPVLDYNHIGESDRFGGRWSLDTNLRVLNRDEGTDSHRISLRPGYEISRLWGPGFVTNLTVNLQTDLYYLDQETSVDPTAPNDGLEGRIMPRLAIDWRYPFVRQTGTVRQLIEPVALAVVAPNGGNPEDIPDEESTVFELDDTNIFSHDRFAGIDRVEGGPRVVYGVKVGLFGPTLGSITAFLGQSYRFHRDRDLEESKLLEEDFSDYVGRIDVRPNEYIDLIYRFRFSESDFDARSGAVTFSIGPPAFKLSGDYFFIDDATAATNSERKEELTIGFSSRISRYWTMNAATQRDLTGDGGSLRHAAGATYEDECFTFQGLIEKSFTRDADIEPDTRVLFKVIFKHLGQAGGRAS